MSVERRLRDGLERSAATVEPDVRSRLPEAISRGKRRQRARRTVLVLSTILLVAGAGGATVELSRFGETAPPVRPGGSHSSVPYAAIAGTYTATLAPTSGVVRNNRMSGRWTLRLDANGVLTLVAPKSFRNVPSGNAFKIEGDRFTTDAFVNDPRCSNEVGAYRWHRTGGSLVFTPITESCAVRRTLFSAIPWHRGS